MDAASGGLAPPDRPPEAREPHVNWDLLRRLARNRNFKTGVQPKEVGSDAKPVRDRGPNCRACGTKYPGGLICGYCRGRLAELRAAAAGGGS